MTRAAAASIQQSQFNDFLFAPMGNEKNGMLLTVLSALARLDVDPWREAGSRRGGGWNWVGVVSGLFNPNDSGVRALERRPRHDEGYHEGGGCGRRSFAFG